MVDTPAIETAGLGRIYKVCEYYRTLKYIYVAPIHPPFYLLGRGILKGSFREIGFHS